MSRKPYFFKIDAGDLIDFATDSDGENITLLQFAKELRKGKSEIPFIQAIIDEAKAYSEIKRAAINKRWHPEVLQTDTRVLQTDTRVLHKSTSVIPEAEAEAEAETKTLEPKPLKAAAILEVNEIDARADNFSEPLLLPKISIFEFRDLFEKATGNLMPVGCNNAANDRCRQFSRDKIEEAFRLTAVRGGKTFNYFDLILQDKPETESPKQRASTPKTFDQIRVENNELAAQKFIKRKMSQCQASSNNFKTLPQLSTESPMLSG